jgi:hypothetical protein
MRQIVPHVWSLMLYKCWKIVTNFVEFEAAVTVFWCNVTPVTVSGAHAVKF